jgi:hypothetical protein
MKEIDMADIASIDLNLLISMEALRTHTSKAAELARARDTLQRHCGPLLN